MKNIACLPALLFFMSLSLTAQDKGIHNVKTTIKNGVIEGIYDTETGLAMYFGIPYAKPPIGNLRWKAPQSADKWQGVLPTKKFGHSPVQTNVFGDMIYRSDTVSEDCLYLNVWAPAEKVAKGLPVLVYFYGGGFVAGDGSEPRYDGASMAQKGIVAVTVNYRLNIFGFFAHPELSKEAPYHASGNYGLLDQSAALRWVQKNISAFGGDPERVTIAGESAGSLSVSALMASPLTKDLIAGAIGESGAAINPTLAPLSLAEAEKIGKMFVKNSGYSSLAELRALSTKELFKIYNDSNRFGFPSVLDGYFYPKSLPEIYGAEKQAQIPLLLGWNSAEISGMGLMQGLSYTEDNYIKKVKEIYPDNYEEVLTLYPHSSSEEIELSATALASDRFIAYSTWKWFDLQRKNSEKPVYRYLYSKLKPVAAQKDMSGENKSQDIGAPHAFEIPYCLGNLHLINNYSWTENDYKVSKTMQNYFANFILTGNPNGDGLPKWPAAGADDQTPPVMVIDVESKAVKAKNDARYRFFDNVFNSY